MFVKKPLRIISFTKSKRWFEKESFCYFGRKKHFCICNTQTFNKSSVIQNLRVSSILCFIKLRLVLLISCLWSRATVHNQNRSVGQGNFHTLGQWLWSNQKEMVLSDMMNYLFWHNRQDCCFSLSSIFISSSLLSDQCWWRYIKCSEFQWNCHYNGFQRSANFLWAQSENGVCTNLSHIPCSPDFPVVITAGSMLAISSWVPPRVFDISECHPVGGFIFWTWKGWQPVSRDRKSVV